MGYAQTSRTVNDMALPAAAVVGTAATAGGLYAGYAGKKIYDAIVDEVDPDGTFSLFAQPPTMNMPGKGAKGADPLTPADRQYMVDKLSGAPAKKATTQADLGESESPSYGESSVDVDAEEDPEDAFAPLVDDSSSSVAPPSAPPIIPDGPWKYQVLAGGVVKIVGAPPGSSAVGMVLDPAKIAALPNGPSKTRLTRAYESIKIVSMGGDPLPRLSATKKPALPPPPPPAAAAPAAQPTLPPPVAQDVAGIPSRTPAFGAGREAAVESSTTSSSEPYGRVRGFIQRFKDKPVEGGGAY